MLRPRRLIGFLALVAALATHSPASAAAPAATITLNQTEFRAGDTLSVGVQASNPADGSPANLYVGVVMPEGDTALFLIPGGATAPVSLADPANFRSLQAAPPGFSLNAPAFSQFTWPTDGLPIGTYILFVALTQASNGSLLALDVKPFTYSPRNVFLPMFRKPFDGDPALGNWFDHDLPFPFTDMNGFLLTWAGERAPLGGDGHNGYDFLMPEGTRLWAVADGTVMLAGPESPFVCPSLNNQIVSGLAVIVRHRTPNGELIESVYGHLSRVDVQVGQHVMSGQQLGLSGNTGCSREPHLHFAVRVANATTGRPIYIDPYGWDSLQMDPWAQHPEGAQSFYLWLPGAAPALLPVPRRLAPNCGTPACGSAAVAITRVTYAGVRDDLNPNNEVVELTLDTRFNSGNPTRDLTGYRLENRAGDTYPMPTGFVIRDGSPVRIYSGRGVNGEAVLFWGLSKEAWNNLVECIQLVSPGGGRYRIGIAGGCS